MSQSVKKPDLRQLTILANKRLHAARARMMNVLRRSTALGVDIGHHTIKAVVLEKVGSGYRVVRHLAQPTPPETVKDGVVIDAKTLGASIKSMLKSGGISAGSAHLAIAGAQIFARPVTFPQMSEAALRKSIRFEAERYIPDSVDDSHIEFEIIGPIDETNMSVLLVSAPKEFVSSRVNVAELAGIDVESVDLEIFASYRALVAADPEARPKDEVIVLVNIGASGASLCIVDHGVFALVRYIPVGGRTFTEALKSHLGLSDEDAELGKSKLNLADLIHSSGAENPPLKAMESHLLDLLREIRRSLNYFQCQKNDPIYRSDVQRIILTGGSALQPGLAEYATHKLGIPTVALGLLENPRFQWAPENGSGAEYVTAVGLAMRGFATHHS